MALNPQLPQDLTLEVVTPSGLLLREQVDEVIAPGDEGYFGVLPGHTPFLSTLGLGEITYRRGTEKGHLTCFWGFAEVLPDRVIVLAERGVLPAEIDREAAERDRIEAEKELAYLSSHDPEFAIVEGRLEESIALIKLGREH
jgi:F-type H+-transporting ATPase subunit epsilon